MNKLTKMIVAGFIGIVLIVGRLAYMVLRTPEEASAPIIAIPLASRNASVSNSALEANETTSAVAAGETTSAVADTASTAVTIKSVPLRRRT